MGEQPDASQRAWWQVAALRRCHSAIQWRSVVLGCGFDRKECGHLSQPLSDEDNWMIVPSSRRQDNTYSSKIKTESDRIDF